MRRKAVRVVAVLVLAGVVFLLLFVRVHTERLTSRSEAMAPTLGLQERFTVNLEVYDSRAPARGEIVVFHPPDGAENDECGAPVRPAGLCARPTRRRGAVRYVMRVVGLPGERLAIREGRAVVNGEPLREPYAQRCTVPIDPCRMQGEVAIPPEHYYVLGDNRGMSADSRYWGPVPRDWIAGRVDDCGFVNLSCSPRR